MHNLFIRLVSIGLVMTLSACGGGGSNSGASASNDTSSTSTAAASATATAQENETASNGSASANTPTPRTTARFYFPSFITSDSVGNLYVADNGNYNIRKITPAGKVSTIAGKVGVSTPVDGPISTATFSTFSGIAVDSNGNIYVSNYSAIRKISTTSGMVTTVAGNLNEAGFLDGMGSDARFHSPGQFTVDKTGNVYVADDFNNAIRKIAPDGKVTTVFQGAPIFQPIGVAIDANGVLYVADHKDIYKIADGIATLLAGQLNTVIDNDSVDGLGTAARFFSPMNLTIDASGTLYLTEADAGGRCGNTGGAHSVVRKITPNSMVTTIAGKPMDFCHVGSADGTGTAADFYMPYGITASPDGNLYVADTGNYAIRKVTPAGTVTTFVGKPGKYGSAD